MSLSELDRHKVDHLFLLVGENPLPNYVAAKLLLQPKGTLYLVHTSGTQKTPGTEKQAIRLQEILDKELEECHPTQLISLEDYESDAYRIQQKIREQIKQLGEGRVGLNYTGGTKAMAVHAYRAALHSMQEKGQKAFFSYLDPRRLKMCIDREDGVSEAIPIRSQDLTISLETIFELHDRKCSKKPNQTPVLSDLASILAEMNLDQAKTKAWFRWFYSIFCDGDDDPNQAARKPKKASGKPGNWKSKTELERLSFPTTCLSQEAIDGFHKQGYLDTNGYLSLEQVKKKGEFKDLQDFCKWLDGTWLEHHLLNQISSIAEETEIFDYGMNFEVPLAGTRDGFEFDVAFTYGYQLFAISCTTAADRSLCKSKLFEAYLRSQQMGGGEARVALFCFVDDLSGLKSEMANLLSDKQIRIFGRKHLANLADEIINWIQDNDTELNE
jgi:hypothetical protein